MTVQRWRKRPVVVEAVLWDLTEVAWRQAQAWGRATGRPVYWRRQGDSLIIATLEGDHEAKPGDYIIKGIQSEIYPCKPDIFLATYEQVPSIEGVPDDPPCDPNEEHGCAACGAPTPAWCQRPGGYQPPQPVAAKRQEGCRLVMTGRGAWCNVHDCSPDQCVTGRDAE